MAEVAFAIIAVGFENIEGLILNLSSRAATRGKFRDIVVIDRQVRDELLRLVTSPAGLRVVVISSQMDLPCILARTAEPRSASRAVSEFPTATGPTDFLCKAPSPRRAKPRSAVANATSRH